MITVGTFTLNSDRAAKHTKTCVMSYSCVSSENTEASGEERFIHQVLNECDINAWLSYLIVPIVTAHSQGSYWGFCL